MTYNWEHWGILRSCIAVSCLQWTSIASRGKQWCSLSLHAEETGIGSGWVDHLARGQTSAFITIVVSSNLEFFKVSWFIWFFFVFKGRGSPRILSRYHPSIAPMHLQIQSVLFFGSCLHTKGCCCCSGFFWPGRHAMSLYLPWMTQKTSERRFLTCSCCPSSVPLTLEGSEYYNASYAISSICLITNTSLLCWCCWCLLQRWEFHGWKPIIYTCDYRGVGLTVFHEFIIPYQKASAISDCFGVTFLRCWFLTTEN